MRSLRHLPAIVVGLCFVGVAVIVIYVGSRDMLTEASTSLDAAPRVECAGEVADSQLLPSASNESRAPERVLAEAIEIGGKVNAKDAHPRSEYGEYKSLRDVQLDAQHFSLVWLPGMREAYVESQLAWTCDDRKTVHVPATCLSSADFELTSEKLERAKRVSEEHREPIAQAAEYTFDLFKYSAEEYSRTGLKKYSKGEVIPQRHPNVDPQLASRYSSTTTILAGDWTFPVEFYSEDYPELQRALVELENLRRRREDDVRAALAD